MRRRIRTLGLVLVTTIAFLAFVQEGFTQQEFSASEAAYRAWRASHPSAETDAARTGFDAGPQLEKASTDEATYAAARRGSLEAVRQLLDKRLKEFSSLDIPERQPADPKPVDAVVAAQTAATNAAANAIADDSDRGLRPLKQALERERAAITALKNAVADQRKSADAMAEALAVVKQGQANIVTRYGDSVSNLEQDTERTAAQQLAWTEYYRLLNQASRIISGRETPSSLSATSIRPANPRTAGQPDRAPAVSNRLTPLVPSITPLPLSRYAGDWRYSTAVRTFKGLEPETANLSVVPQDGQFSGHLSVRFKASPDAPSDRTVQFQFSGAMQTTRIQKFEFQTADGTKGMLDLVPGTAFNLLEVTFEMEPRSGGVSKGSFVLIKK
jgi:hypothetical protein